MYLMHPSCSESSNLCWGPATSIRQPAFCHFLHMMCQTTAHRACGVVHCITQSDERARPLVISSWIGKRQQRATAYSSRHSPHDSCPTHPFTASTRAKYVDQNIRLRIRILHLCKWVSIDLFSLLVSTRLQFAQVTIQFDVDDKEDVRLHQEEV